jgi:hypothetical protein
VIFFYPRERVVLRDGVVVEVERVAADPIDPGASSTPPAEPLDDATDSGAPPAAATTQVPAGEPRFEIKLVRPPSATDRRPAIPEPAREPPVSTPPAPTPVVPTIVPPETSTPAERTPAPGMEEKRRPLVDTPAPPAEPDPVEERPAAGESPANESEPAAKIAPRRPDEAFTPDPAGPVMSGRGYLLALVVIAGGAVVLYWRHRQRQLELAASSVENTPLAKVMTPVFTGNGFTADMISKLEWKRFEELVAAYYSKTGVVAVRTKTGPDSPVQIKISWKGEPRPFAYVQCIARPPGLIDPKPLQALIAALAADDIRRGYVVTTGKFNVPARDLAEEKHLTLVPGDTFLEKLNALPASARAELMQSIAGGDPVVPSCPKCDAKMVQSADIPPVWRCPNHPDQTMPVRK